MLVSGGGTNLQAIIDAHGRGAVKNCELAAVISSSPDAYALTRAENAGIRTVVADRGAYGSRAEFDAAVARAVADSGAELIVLSGFMFILPAEVAGKYGNRIINVHPALIPSFCGKGFYGLRVHEAAIAAGVRVTGATVHFADGGVDSGPIILQKAVDVLPDDTPESLQRRVMEQAEHIILPRAVSLFCEGRLRVDGKRVFIEGE